MEDKKVIIIKDIVLEKKPVKSSDIPEGYSEIITKYLSMYFGCWIKYTSKETGLSHSGGYMIDITDDETVILRNIRKDIFELKISEYIFYCKNDTPQNRSVKFMIEERDRFSLKVQAFNIEKQKFLEKYKKLNLT